MHRAAPAPARRRTAIATQRTTLTMCVCHGSRHVAADADVAAPVANELQQVTRQRGDWSVRGGDWQTGMRQGPAVGAHGQTCPRWALSAQQVVPLMTE